MSLQIKTIIAALTLILFNTSSFVSAQENNEEFKEYGKESANYMFKKSDTGREGKVVKSEFLSTFETKSDKTDFDKKDKESKRSWGFSKDKSKIDALPPNPEIED